MSHRISRNVGRTVVIQRVTFDFPGNQRLIPSAIYGRLQAPVFPARPA
ncbi:hypothetical protein [Rahnella perminowiae]|nr:hypothetical protein [Rahnella perminowiae]